ncbi:phosphomannose isomerase type II C-terminal cupin domain [Candidatus Woesearchaeota archaeon]|nr:phosphomannose isomerase type II C-terminal cupin domain [Candidatus Woesearchaeota archaeon]
MEKEDILKDIVTVEKPWGEFKQFIKNRKCTVKIITVNEGEILSLQEHSNRTELWCMIDDGLHVTVGNTTRQAAAGEEFVIKPGKKHRISAPEKQGRFLEISFGEFDEEDIVRHEDKYGRE